MRPTGKVLAFPVLTEGKRSRSRTCGLDTVGVSFRISPDWDPRGGTLTVKNAGLAGNETVTCRQQLPGGGFAAMGIGGKAWVEASAKRAGGGCNVEALSAPEAFESMREACREAESFCTSLEPFEDYGLVRLDVVRDFDAVDHVGELLDGLASVARVSRYKTRRFGDAERNLAETLTVGPKAHHGTLYDKWAETGGEAPKGRVRFEARTHQDQLSSVWARELGVEMHRVHQVTAEKIEILGRASFERYSFDREVQAMASLSAKVLDPANGLSASTRHGLWAFLTAPGYGAMLSKGSRSKYRVLARELGVSLRPGVDEDVVQDVLVRLDFDAGREVCRVA